MKFYVMNYVKAQAFQPVEPTLAIRIFDPKCQEAEGNNPKQKLQPSSLWVAELHYTFADYDEARYFDYPQEVQEERRRGVEDQLITDITAKRILQDFQKHRTQATAVMIHCNAGMSRSPSVALALCHRFQIQPEWAGTRKTYMRRAEEEMAAGRLPPNSSVYDLLMEVDV